MVPRVSTTSQARLLFDLFWNVLILFWECSANRKGEYMVTIWRSELTILDHFRVHNYIYNLSKQPLCLTFSEIIFRTSQWHSLLSICVICETAVHIVASHNAPYVFGDSCCWSFYIHSSFYFFTSGCFAQLFIKTADKLEILSA